MTTEKLKLANEIEFNINQLTTALNNTRRCKGFDYGLHSCTSVQALDDIDDKVHEYRVELIQAELKKNQDSFNNI